MTLIDTFLSATNDQTLGGILLATAIGAGFSHLGLHALGHALTSRRAPGSVVLAVHLFMLFSTICLFLVMTVSTLIVTTFLLRAAFAVFVFLAGEPSNKSVAAIVPALQSVSVIGVAVLTSWVDRRIGSISAKDRA